MLAMQIIAGLLLLVLLLLCCPVRVVASLRGGQPVVQIKYLFLLFPLYPLPEKAPGAPAKRKKAKKPKPQKEKPPPEQLTLQQQWNRLRPLLATSKDALRALLRHVIIDRIRGQIVVAGTDAHKTALAYARAVALASALLELLGALFTVKKHALTLTPGFAAQKGSAELSLRLSLRPIFAVAAGLRMLLAFISFRSRPAKRRKPAPARIQ